MTNFIINPSDKHFPEADKWMWDYCIFLGKFTGPNGSHYDLGIHITRSVLRAKIIPHICAAIVYGNKDGQYNSGSLDSFELKKLGEDDISLAYDETYLRAKMLNLLS